MSWLCWLRYLHPVAWLAMACLFAWAATRRSAAPRLRASRNGEAGRLAVVSLAVIAGVLAAAAARTRQPDVPVLDLRGVRTAGQLLPVLQPAFTDPAERDAAATAICAFLERSGPLPNVGALHQVRGAMGKRALLTAAQISAIKPRLAVRSEGEFRRALWLWTLVYLAGFWLAHVVWRARGFSGDAYMLPVIEALTGAGLIAMIGLRDPLRDTLTFASYAQGVAGGCALLVALSLLDHERLFGKLSFVPFLLSVLLSAALIVFGSGPGTSEAKINLGPFQPVEAIKILLAFFLAGYFAKNWEFLRQLKEKRHALAFLPRWVKIPRLDYYLPVILCLALARLFFVLEKDLGPALVLSFLFISLYAVACSRPRLAFFGVAAVSLGFWASYRLGMPPTVAGRVQMWLSPWDNTARGGDQLAHSLWAMASGGVFGTGPGLGHPDFIPAGHTDLALAVVGEEWGFVGLLALFVLYAVLFQRAWRVIRAAQSDYAFFLALGLTMLTALPLLLISGGILGVMPLSGVVTPFLSYGRTAMLANFAVFAILISLSRQSGKAREIPAFAAGTRWLGAIVVLLGSVMIARAAYVQVLRGDQIVRAGTLVPQADGARRFSYNPRLVELAHRIVRAGIYDRNGLPVATSRWDEIEAHRADYESMGIRVEDTCSRFEARHYPLGGDAFHLLGEWPGRRNWGAGNTAYVEKEADTRLRGFDDHARAEELIDRWTGRPLRVVRYDYRELVPWLRQCQAAPCCGVPSAERSVRLPMDARLQVAVARILDQRLRRAAKQKAAVVVLDSESGEVLALVNRPAPGAAEALPESEAFLDRARFGLYPPGSVFKLVTVAAALRVDPRLAQAAFSCRRLPGGRVGAEMPGWGRPVRDDVTDKTPHGTLTMEEAITVSCNAYFAQLAAYRIGAPALREAAGLLGIAVARDGSVERLRESLPQAAYGQGEVLASPLQIARLAAMIANGGMAVSPPRRVLERDAADTIARSMRRAVTDGTARSLRDSAVPIAGKTGTAELNGAPSHAWFAGFAPYGAPGRRIAFAVLVENGQYGGGVAAAIAGDVVNAAKQLGIAP